MQKNYDYLHNAILRKAFMLCLVLLPLSSILIGWSTTEVLDTFDPPAMYAPLDTDNDGVPDYIDLDDDNDGILDTDEVDCVTFAPSTILQPVLVEWQNANLSVVANRTYEFTGISTLGSRTVTGGPEMGNTVTNAAIYRTIEGLWVDFDGNRYYPDNSYFTTTPSQAIPALNLTALDYSTLHTYVGMVDVNGNGSYDSGIDEILYPIFKEGENVRITPTGSGDVYIVYADDIYSDNSGGLTYEVLECPEPRDTDNDGITDDKDTDSDNDGCFDTIEAGHADGDNDGVLGNSPVTVDSNGLVTGQGGYTGTNANVTTPIVPVVIDTQPSDHVVNVGGNVTFTAAASGGATLSYQWQESTDNGATWNNIVNGGIYAGTDTNSLSLTGVGIPDHDNDYRLVVSTSDNNCDTYVSTAADLFVRPTLTVEDVSAVEGGTLAFAITPSHVVNQDITFDLSYFNISTTAADYSAIANGTLPANALSVIINVPAVDDTIIEPTETFTLGIINGNGFAGDISDTAIGTITDNDGGAGFGISVADFTVDESAGTATFTVLLNTNVQGGFSVDFTVINGSAVSPNDYTVASNTGTLTFTGTSGEVRSITVNIIDDTFVEANENLGITLSGLSTGLINMLDGNGTGTIVDNDTASITMEDTGGLESAGSLSFNFILTGNVQGPFTINYTTSDDTATAGADYVASSGTLTFSGTDGEVQTATFTILEDTLEEPTERFNVTASYSGTINGLSFTTNPETVAIVDNDFSGTYQSWTCDARLYQTVRVNADMILYEINTSTGSLNQLANLSDNGVIGQINSIGYNPIDNFIYGIHPDNYTLYKIDANGLVQNLGQITGLAGYNQAGAFDIFGNFYVTGASGSLYRVDINTATATFVGTTGINVSDIAINPENGLLYGWDEDQRQLVTIDPADAGLNYVGVPNSQYSVFGALYYDANNGIIAYGDDINVTATIQETLVTIDPYTGILTPLANGPGTNTNDGCSCVFSIEFDKSANDSIDLCSDTSISFTYTIFNNTGTDLTNINFRETLLFGLTYASEPYNVTPGLTFSNTLTGLATSMASMSVPVGESIFTIDVEVPITYAGPNVYSNLTYIDNINSNSPGLPFRVDSDDPDTPTINDVTDVTISINDNDNDNIPNCYDLDDDNDGILDTEESCAFFNSTQQTGVTFSQPSGSGSYSQFMDGGLWLSVFDGAYSVRATKTVDEAVAGDEITVNFNGYQSRSGNAGPVNAPGEVTIELGGVTLYNDTYNHYVATYGRNLGRSSFTLIAPIDAPVLTITYVRPTGDGFDIMSGHFDYQVACDTDNDGILDKDDLDSDNDGCFDVVESEGVDSDNDGFLDGTGIGSNGRVTGGTGGYNGPTGNETVATQVTVDTAPLDQNVPEGNGIFFAVNANATNTYDFNAGTPDYFGPSATNTRNNIRYQWQENGTPLTDTGVYSGTNTATLAISDVTGLDGNTYTVIITHTQNNCISLTESAMLTTFDPCDPIASGNRDSDGDGVSDICDLDDDNDGILDTEESCAFFNSTQQTGVTFSQPSGSGPYAQFMDGGLWLSVFDGAYSVRATKTVDEAVAGDEITVNFNGYQSRSGNAGPVNAPGEVTIELGGVTLYNDTYNHYVATYGRNLGRSSFTLIAPIDAPVLTITYVRPTGDGFDIMSGHFDYQVACDTDNDGILDKDDLDSDNDGCFDTVEAGHTDGDGDGILGNSPVTQDSNGLVIGQDGYTGSNTNVTTPLVLVIIDTLPTDQTTNIGGTATFTAVVSGGVSLSYQWQESTDNGGTWNDIANGGIYSGTDTNSLTLTGVGIPHHDNDYRLVITSSDNNCDTFTSIGADLFVRPTLTVEDISTVEGGDLTFVITASHAVNQDLTFDLTYADITTTAADYSSIANGTLPANAVSVNINVPTLDDTIIELTETFTFGIANGNAFAGDLSDTAIGTITDNDGSGPGEGISVADFTVDERVGTADFVISYTGPTVQNAFTIDFLVTDGTATDPNDYSVAMVGTQISFPAGTANGDTQVVTINIVDDSIIESTEDLNITLSNIFIPVINMLDGTGVGTITDNDANDPLTEGIALAEFTINEDAGTTTFVVSYTGNTVPDAFNVNFSVADNTAIDPDDYTVANTDVFVTFPAGTVSGDTQLVTVNIVDDVLIEATETLDITLAFDAVPPVGINMLDGTGVGTITDNDANDPMTEGIVVADFTVNEDSRTATFVISYTGNTVQDAFNVNFNVADNTAINPDDYTVANTDTFVTFPAGTVSGDTQLVTVNILDDVLIEATETLDITLAFDAVPPVGINMLDGTGVGTITDNDANDPMTEGIVVADFTVNEDSRTATFVISYTGNTVQDAFNVNFNVADNTAINPDDYTVANTDTFVTFPSGTVSGDTQLVTVNIVDDVLIEATETLDITLAFDAVPPAGINMLDGTGVGTITDNDANDPMTEGIAVADFTINEDAGTTTFVVSYTGNTVQDAFNVNFNVADNTAINPDDYSVANTDTFVTFPAGTVSGDTQLVTINIVDDVLIEATETLDITLAFEAVPPVGINMLDGTGVGTITDNDANDPMTEGIVVADFTINEDAGTATFVVSYTGNTVPDAFNANFSVADNTAIDPDDYTVANTDVFVTFPAGTVSGDTQLVTVNIVDDVLIEATETLYITLAFDAVPPVGINMLDGTGVGTITDNDANDPMTEGIVVADFTVNEDSRTATFVISYTGNTVQDAFNVNFNVTENTAIDSDDYTVVAPSGTLTFPANTLNGNSQTITVGIIDDEISEITETLDITVSFDVTPPAGLNILDGEGVGTILDNEISASAYEEEVTILCGEELPEIPELTFMGGCGNYDILFNEETEVSDESDDYMVIRTWVVADLCGNTESFQQIVFVMQPQLEEIFIDICLEDDPINLIDYLPQGFDEDGIFETDVGDAYFSNGTFTPNGLEVEEYKIMYSSTDGTCKYYVDFYITTNADCVSCTRKDIEVSKTLTVNGDGTNDYFEIKGVENCSWTFDLMIINRWGNKVYEGKNYQNDWGGFAPGNAVGNSGHLPTGTYYYILTMHSSEQPSETINGFIYIGTN